MSLAHHHPDCTGRSHFVAISTCQYCRCGRCGAIGYATGADHEAVIQENLAGFRLDQLMKEGREMLGEAGT